jgi:uncharacterized protein RhaS with RHS repeats
MRRIGHGIYQRGGILAAKKKRQPRASSWPTSTPKNRVWGFENHPSGRPSVEPQLSLETATGSVQYTYQIASGRAEWLSRDPIAERGGINLYGYVLNDPIYNVDELGLFVSFNLFNGNDQSSQHGWINIGPDCNGDKTYGRYPSGTSLSDLFSNKSTVTSPDILHGDQTSDYNSVVYDSTPAEEQELENFISKNYDLNQGSTQNGSYNLIYSNCFNFAQDIINKLKQIRNRDKLPVTYKVCSH